MGHKYTFFLNIQYPGENKSFTIGLNIETLIIYVTLIYLLRPEGNMRSYEYKSLLYTNTNKDNT